MSGPGQASDRSLKKLSGLACFMFCWRSDARAVDRIITCFNLQSNHLVNQGIFSQFNIKSFFKRLHEILPWKIRPMIKAHEVHQDSFHFGKNALFCVNFPIEFNVFEWVSWEIMIWGSGYCLNIQYKVRSWWSSERPVHTKRGSHSPLTRRWDDHKY